MVTFLKSARTSLLAAAIVLAICAPILVWATHHYEALLIAERRVVVQHQLELRSRALAYNFARVAGTLDAMVAVATKKEHFETLAQGLRANLPWVRAFQLVEDGVITQVFPVPGNEASLGYRLFEDQRPVIGGDVRRALDSGRITITGPIELVQGGLGLIVRKPFERTGTEKGRLAAVVCNATDLLRESLLGHGELQSEGLDLALRVEGREPFWGERAVFLGDPVIISVPMADDVWELAARPTLGWAAEVAAPVRWFLLAGLVIASLLTVLGGLLARRHSSLTQTVSLRDKEIQSQHKLLRAVVEGAQDAIFIKDLEGRYLMVNEACARLFGRSEAEVIGRLDTELLEPRDAVTILATDARIRETGQPQSYEETLTLLGQPRTFNTVKVPHRDAAGAVVGIIGWRVVAVGNGLD
ncbi:MAG TPA: PAS domain-containing protein, partial [Myxococcota bacterium]|nr:PAS domain-containing protein [Myxococcota bacterium]